MKKSIVFRTRAGMRAVKRMPPGEQAVISYADLFNLIWSKGQVRLHERVSHLRFDREGITYRIADRKVQT